MDITVARIVQLVARVLAFVLVTKWGMDADKAQSLVGPASELCGAGLLVMIDLAIHSGRFGWLAGMIQDVFEFAPKDAGKGGGGAAVILALALLGAGLTSCAQSETNRAAQGMILVQVHASNAADLIKAGSLTAGQAQSVQQAVHAERDAVNAYYDAIEAGDSAQLATAKAALTVATTAAEEELAKYHLPAMTPIVIPALTQPATQP